METWKKEKIEKSIERLEISISNKKEAIANADNKMYINDLKDAIVRDEILLKEMRNSYYGKENEKELKK